MVLILGLERDLPTIILCATCKHGQNPVGQVGEGPCAGRGPAQILHVNNGLLESCWSDNVYASLILLFFIYLIKSDSSCPPPLSIFLIMLLLELRVNYFYPLSPSIKILLCIFFRNPVPSVLWLCQAGAALGRGKANR